MRIATILGTRPAAIKMAPVIRALDASPDFDHTLIVPGQHRELLDQVLTLFALKHVPAQKTRLKAIKLLEKSLLICAITLEAVLLPPPRLGHKRADDVGPGVQLLDVQAFVG